MPRGIFNRPARNTILTLMLLIALCFTLRWNLRSDGILVAPADAARRPQIDGAFGKLPLSFESSHGQAEFTARGPGYHLGLKPAEAALELRNASDEATGRRGDGERSRGHLPSSPSPRRPVAQSPSRPVGNQSAIRNPQSATLRMKLVGANAQARITGQDELPGKSNYLIGADPRQWRTGVPHYARVKCEAVYPGIDLIYYGNQQELEYDFVMQPGADAGAIKLRFEGARRISIESNGDLVLRTDSGELRQRKPVIYQEVNGERRGVEGAYVIRSLPQAVAAIRNQVVGFGVGEYDRHLPLVIDPVLRYATYLRSPCRGPKPTCREAPHWRASRQVSCWSLTQPKQGRTRRSS